MQVAGNKPGYDMFIFHLPINISQLHVIPQKICCIQNTVLSRAGVSLSQVKARLRLIKVKLG
jgi:hypothetical protein